MGGSWDATNVADARGRGGAADRRRPRAATSATRPPTIAVEKAGIIKPGATAVLAEQAAGRRRGAARAGRRGRRDRRPRGPGVRRGHPGARRSAARWSRCRACAARYDEVFLPLYGAHQAQNAAVALAAVEAFLGGDEPLDADLVRDGVRRGHLAGPARGHPAQPDDRARRRAQPARRRGHRGGARGLVHASTR